MTGRNGTVESSDPNDGRPIAVEQRGATRTWSLEETVVLLAQALARGPAADCLCPTISCHADRHRAEEYLRDRPELTGLVLGQARAVQIAAWSFGSLLAVDPEAGSGPMTTGVRA